MAKKKKWKTVNLDDLNKAFGSEEPARVIPGALDYNKTLVQGLAQLKGGYSDVVAKGAKEILESRRPQAKPKPKFNKTLDMLETPSDAPLTFTGKQSTGMVVEAVIGAKGKTTSKAPIGTPLMQHGAPVISLNSPAGSGYGSLMTVGQAQEMAAAVARGDLAAVLPTPAKKQKLSKKQQKAARKKAQKAARTPYVPFETSGSASSQPLNPLLINGQDLDKLSEAERQFILSDSKERIGQLEVDVHWGTNPVTGKWQLFADIPNENTGRRITQAFNQEPNVLLGDLPMDYKTYGMPGVPKDFRPISEDQKALVELVNSVFEKRRLAPDGVGITLPQHERMLPREYEILEKGILFDQAPENITAKEFARVINSNPMLEGMDKLGLDLRVVINAANNSEVFPDRLVTPADELSRVSVAEGRTRRLDDFKKVNFSTTFYDDYDRWVRGLPVDNLHDETNIYSFLTTKLDAFKAMRNLELDRAHEDYLSRLRHGNAVDDYFSFIESEENKLAKQAERDLFRTEREARQAEKAAERAAEMERRRKPFQFNPDYMARYENLEPQQRAVATAARTEGRMTSSIADTIADDTMRAASVIHSSKLGFAAVGAGVIGAAFGIQSMRNRNEERRRNLR